MKLTSSHETNLLSVQSESKRVFHAGYKQNFSALLWYGDKVPRGEFLQVQDNLSTVVNRIYDV